jgi:hypothetical protein
LGKVISTSSDYNTDLKPLLPIDFTMPTIKDKSGEVLSSIEKHSEKIGE